MTVRVVGHVLGKKIRIGKYRSRTGYRRHTGHRSKLTQIEVESIGAKKRAAPKKETEAAAEDKPKAAAKKPAADEAQGRSRPQRKKTEEAKDGA